MKLPKGYGCITKLSGNRRRPYMIQKNKKIIGYARTRREGLDILAEYNRNPFDEKDKLTFRDVFDLMIKHKSETINPHTLKNYKSKFNHDCKPLYDIPYKELRLHHFTDVIDSLNVCNGTKNNLRKFFRAMDAVAFEFDIIDKQYSQFIPSYRVESSERTPFTEDEIITLWNNLDTEDVDLVLMLIYTGFRSGEFCQLTIDNIDLDNGFITGGLKTKAGKNRKVPIHHKIKPLIQHRIGLAKKDTLLNYSDKTLRIRFKKVMDKLGMSHIPHECRHTLRTRLDNNEVNSVTIDLILGHQSKGIGERVYTHKTFEQLTEAIETLN